MKIGQYVQMGSCIIKILEESDGPDVFGEVVEITDPSTAEGCGVYIGLVDSWEVLNKIPLED